MKHESITDKLYQLVDEIPGDDGWWEPEAQTTYYITATRMLDAGINIDDIIDLLSRLYYDTLGEAKRFYL